MRVSPIWHAVVCGAVGKVEASAAPDLPGSIFTVEKYVLASSFETATFSLE